MIRDFLYDVLYPESAICIGCGVVLSPASAREGSLCGACRTQLTEKAWFFLSHSINNGTPEVCSAWPHADLPRHLVHQLKYSAIARAAREIAPFLVIPARPMELPEHTVVTWVPMPENRRQDRGIDHGQRLAAAVAGELGLELRPLLKRKKETRHTQQGLNRNERIRNLRNTFEALGPTDFPVLLVDDVLTTGSTFLNCRNVLLSAGAPSVRGVTATASDFRASNRKSRIADILIDIFVCLALLYLVHVVLIGG